MLVALVAGGLPILGGQPAIAFRADEIVRAKLQQLGELQALMSAAWNSRCRSDHSGLSAGMRSGILYLDGGQPVKGSHDVVRGVVGERANVELAEGTPGLSLALERSLADRRTKVRLKQCQTTRLLAAAVREKLPCW